MALKISNSDLPAIIPRKVLFSAPVKYNPKLSPDGKKLAYLAPVDNIINIWIKTIGQEDDRVITGLKKTGINYNNYYWANNKYIIYLQDINCDENWLLYKLNIETEEIKLLTPYKNTKVKLIAFNNESFPDELIISMNKDNPIVYDLYHIDLISDTLTLLEKNPGNITEWLVDHNLKLRAIVLQEDDGRVDLMVRENENSEWKTLRTWNIEDRPLSQPVAFSKDNNYIYLIDSYNHNTSRVVKMETKTGNSEVIANDPEYDIYAILPRVTHTYDMNTILFKQKTYEIQAVSFNKFRKEWIILDETIKEDFEAIKDLSRGDFSIISRDNGDKLWIIGFEKDNGPTSHYIFDRKTKKGSFLFDNNPSLNDYTLSHMEEITFTSRDGLTIHGYITYPTGKSKKNLPLVLFVHSGPWDRDTWGYNPVLQWFANRGYACLQVNYRGSLGYGKDFLNAGNKEWGGKMQDDLTDAVNWAIKEGIANPEQIAIYGSGYGGYAALTGATFTPELFSCAIAIQCPGDLITFMGSIPEYWKSQRKRLFKRLGDPSSDRELLISRSPIYKLNQIKIPILIAYGLNNPRTKSAEPYKIVKTLKSKGIEVEHVVFPDEGYEINKPENRIKFYGIAEKFLTKHLKGRYEDREIHMKEIYISDSLEKNFDDRIIIDKIIKEGDKYAFEHLMEYYKKPLLKHLFNMTGNFNLSMELLQETFFRVWLYIDSYAFFEDIPFISWLFKIATNVTKKHRIKHFNLNNEMPLDETDIETDTEWEKNIEDKILIQSILTSLKQPYKTSLMLRFIEELDYKEIASIMKTTPSKIKTYLFRAKKSIVKSWTNQMK
jgi:RNA polymerase sigma factor (sigma-70 family)